MTWETANAMLGVYPQWLASINLDVPPEYLDGSLLPDDWVLRPTP